MGDRRPVRAIEDDAAPNERDLEAETARRIELLVARSKTRRIGVRRDDDLQPKIAAS